MLTHALRTIVFTALAPLVLIPAAQADEFGPRFGSNTPYALQNTLDNAARDMQGVGMDDLNDITPQAGIVPAVPSEEVPEAQEGEQTPQAQDDVQVVKPDQKPAP